MKSLRSLCLFSAKDAVHQCCAARLHSVSLPHDGTVCTFTLCCISFMLQQPLACLRLCRHRRTFGIILLRNNDYFAELNHYSCIDLYLAFTYFLILKMFMHGFNSIVIQETPEFNQCFEKRGREQREFLLLLFGQ